MTAEYSVWFVCVLVHVGWSIGRFASLCMHPFIIYLNMYITHSLCGSQRAGHKIDSDAGAEECE